jgi:hypothetical protein
MIGGVPMDRLVLLLDAVIAVLLLATIVYAAILHRKLSVLRDSRQQMEQLVGRFTEANATAEKVLAEIRQAAGESGQALQSSIERGNALADDLMFLVERAGGLAKRLEGTGLRSGGVARAKDPEVRRTATAQPAATAGAAGETDFVKALRGLR